MVCSLQRVPAAPDPPAGFRLRSIDPAQDAVALHGVDAASFAPAPDYTPESLTEFTAGLREVRLGVASYNPRALHVYERLGMTERFRFDVYERPADPSRADGQVEPM